VAPSGDQPGRRWPAWVYGDGTEPDPRFSLANERTFLAWIRTSIAMLAAAVAVEALDLPLPAVVQTLAAVLLGVMGLVTAAWSFLGWARTEAAMRRGRPLPSSPVPLVVAASVAVVAVAVVVAAVLG
jgi:putative membrane protein